jgi:DNA-binding SARP family transcriptional activator
MPLRIYLLGQPRFTRDEHPVDLPGYRPVALLAYLLLGRKAYRRQHLIDLFFDGPDAPRAALRWTLSKLRTAIGAEYILADKDEVSFNFQSDYWLDVFAFETGETELYQGDLLEGLYLRDAPRFEDWLLFERERLRSTNQAQLEEQLKGYRQQGDQAAVVITAQQLLKLDHLREDWQAALMEAYARLGKRAAALEQYEKFRQALRKEWGEEPAPETVALAKAIQRDRPGAVIAPVEIDLGSTDATHTVVERAGEHASSPTTMPGRGLSRAAWRVLGAVGLFIATLFVLGMTLNEKSWALLNQLIGSSLAGSAGQSAADSQ